MNPEEGSASIQSEQLNLRDIGSAARDVTVTFREVIRSEVQLAKAEFKDSAARVGSHSAKMAVAGVFAISGLLPFIAFLVIGLGHWLNGNYWLSSLLISLFFFVCFGAIAYRNFKLIQKEGLGLPETMRTLNEDAGILQSRVEKIRERKRRATA
jgi:hypothetical protein